MRGMRSSFHGVPFRGASEPSLGASDANLASLTHTWQWRDGSLIYTRRKIVLFNWRAQRRSCLSSEVRAEFAQLGCVPWERVAHAAWLWWRFLKPRVHVALAGNVPRACRRCGSVFVPTVRSHLHYCSERCRMRLNSRTHYHKVASTEAGRAKLNATARGYQTKARRARGVPSWETRLADVAPTYGNWTVLREDLVEPGAGRRILCRCACGVERAVRLAHLRRGDSTRCKRCASRARYERDAARLGSNPLSAQRRKRNAPVGAQP